MTGRPESHGAAFAALEEHAQDLFDQAPCGYLSAAPDGTLLRVNQTFLDWTGYAREELVGVRRFQDLLSVGGRIYHETHYAPLLRMQGAVREIALDLLAAGGARLPVLVNAVMVRDEAGTPLGVRTVVLDARERLAYERELVAARDRERAARERTEVLQRITAVLAAAADARAAGAAVVAELLAALGATRGGLAVVPSVAEEPSAVAGPPPPPGGVPPAPRFDDGAPARARLPCGEHGLLWLEWEGSRVLEDAERAFLVACATQTATVLERLELHRATREVAHELQRSLLADALPHDERIELAAVYQPAVAELEVGGDWYDAFELTEGRLAVVVGDVVGRGLHAASAMGQLRSAVRALAAAGIGPAALLGHLDGFVEQVEPARYATVIYVEVDAAAGRATFASAGHLPAALVAPDGRAELLMAGRSAPLGVVLPGAPRPQAEVELAPGGGFVLVTDGLIERRGETIDAALERLLDAVRASPATVPSELVGVLLDRCLPAGAGGDDDVCLLSLRRRPGPGTGPDRPAAAPAHGTA